MSKDLVWPLIRAFINSTGVAVMVYAYVNEAQLEAIIGGLCALGSVLWMVYVRYNTKAVPLPTVNRLDLPTVSSATGARELPPSKQP